MNNEARGQVTLRSKDDLIRILGKVDRRGYKAYKEIEGLYNFGDFFLSVDHVQSDPFAPPSRVSAFIRQELAGFPGTLWMTRLRRVALQDYLARQFRGVLDSLIRRRRGTGKGGLISIDSGGQEIIERSALMVDERGVEARFVVGLPAAGRTILAKEAKDMFFNEIPHVVRKTLFYEKLDAGELVHFVDIFEDQEFLRNQLESIGLVAFIKNGAILPRISGVDYRPLQFGVVPFKSPPELEVKLEVPHAGRISGMGIPKGVTLIVGGGFHGKSTLLKSIELGVYNHIPGDGREYVVTNPTAAKIRAEDGRNVVKVNISPFINNLPIDKDTFAFSTENASGSTSQAANIIEALEMGTELLLIDEDTSATNFMVRDVRMQELVSKAKEPITPFIDKVQQLYIEFGVSTILVMGGCGDYFDVADHIIMMDGYRPMSVTEKARDIANRYGTERKDEGGAVFGNMTTRRPLPNSFRPGRGKKQVKIDAKGPYSIIFGKTLIDLSCLEQLVDISQTRSIAYIIHYYATHHVDREKTLKAGLEASFKDLGENGLDMLVPFRVGNLAMPRIIEVAQAINRMRTLEMT
jgi:predicted ABC-class ATPase